MVVVDNSCLSSLKKANQLRILTFFFDQITIPQSVFNEYKSKYDYFEIEDDVNIESVSDDEISKEFSNVSTLSFADKEAISLSRNKLDLLISDDKRIRNYCQSNRIEVIGTLRLLKNGYTIGYFNSKTEYFLIIDGITTDLYLNEELIE